MRILAIDPGPTESTYVIWNGARIISRADLANGDMLGMLAGPWIEAPKPDCCAIEQIRGYGVPAGNETFDTCWWSGRFYQAWGRGAVMLPRKEVTRHICGADSKGGDKYVREALIARFGDPGKKAAPGVLYGVTSHCWAALAVAVCCYDRYVAGTATAEGRLK